MAHLLLDKKAIRDIEHDANMIITDDDGDSGVITIQRTKPNTADIYGKSYFCLFDLIKPQDKEILEGEISDKIFDTKQHAIDFEIDDHLAGRFHVDMGNTNIEKVREYAVQMAHMINYWNAVVNKYGKLAKAHYEDREKELSKLIE